MKVEQKDCENLGVTSQHCRARNPVMDKTKESLKIKFDNYSVYHDQDYKLDLVVAVHTKLGPNLTHNNTFQGLVGLRVPQLQKRT